MLLVSKNLFYCEGNCCFSIWVEILETIGQVLKESHNQHCLSVRDNEDFGKVCITKSTPQWADEFYTQTSVVYRLCIKNFTKLKSLLKYSLFAKRYHLNNVDGLTTWDVQKLLNQDWKHNCTLRCFIFNYLPCFYAVMQSLFMYWTYLVFFPFFSPSFFIQLNNCLTYNHNIHESQIIIFLES